MQVRKFEAKSVKEALEMVKTQLGPEAIILAVKDNKKKYGLVGEGSIEITAAVSERVLEKKRFAESRLTETDRGRLSKSSAKTQKVIIEKMVNRYLEESTPSKAVTSTRYIDIRDGANSAPAKTEPVSLAAPVTQESPAGFGELASQRIRYAVSDAVSAWLPNKSGKGDLALPSVQADKKLIANLQGELSSLKATLEKFQNIPQLIHPVGQHPGAGFGLSYDVAASFEKLTAAGMAEDIVAEILRQAEEVMPPQRRKNKALVDAWVAQFIMDSTLIADQAKASDKIHLFLGPAGSGKTSSLVKIASHSLIRNQSRIALATADVGKVGSVEQMRIYAQILNVPFLVIRNQEDFEKLRQMGASLDAVYVDYPGLGLKNVEELSQLRKILPREQLVTTTRHLVLSALSKDSDLHEIGKRYKMTNFTDVIFTGLDEAVQHGNIYNFMSRFQTPLHSFGIGRNIPEDIEMATKERVLDLMFKLTKVRKEMDVER